MKTYLVGTFFYRIIEAENPTKAWLEYILADMQINAIWDREDARQTLMRRGYKIIRVTTMDYVYEVLK